MITDELDLSELAVAVLARAVRDAASRDHNVRRHRNEARIFLQGGEPLQRWCQLAGIDPETVKRQAVDLFPVRKTAA